eukprot:CAMPEP_0204610444 /NCGR_PEP_ID=MMETSP0661-20131031/61508_1 /ASSEMBLY_ACC=CAM_ASM_000606 /TAXON_ID=109239 /ORGANISM="Alexandrium margalefi, Strain AMGDE01CS-322" /LENGTH=86 /DNA_ID=CAMNT_0051622255 /DNA_START=793 /DNA_END=1050 /DNA_ORIENTATION=+
MAKAFIRIWSSKALTLKESKLTYMPMSDPKQRCPSAAPAVLRRRGLYLLHGSLLGGLAGRGLRLGLHLDVGGLLQADLNPQGSLAG